MAFNEDLQWEDHRPICRTEEVVEDLGIEAEEAGNWWYWIVSMALSAVFLIAMFVEFRRTVNGFGGLLPPQVALLWAIFFGLDRYLNSVMRKYRLYSCDGGEEAASEGRWRNDALIRYVANNPRLYAQLGEALKFRPIVGADGGYIHTFFILCAAFVGLYSILVGRNIPLATLSLGVIGLMILRWCYGRIALNKGLRRFGTGLEEEWEPPLPYSLEDVDGAEIRWNAFLGQSYLELEVGGKTMPYYNPSRDPLYLLRLVKHGMPDGVLQRADGAEIV